MSTNRLSISITDAQKQEVNQAAADLTNATKNFNVVIDKETVKSLSKLGDTRIPCVEKVMQYAVSNPEFLPPFADVPEFQKDFKTFLDVREMLRPLMPVIQNLQNTGAVCGSEAWEFARNYYKTVQFNAKMGVPGAQAIYDDLRPLFEQSPKNEPDGEPAK